MTKQVNNFFKSPKVKASLEFFTKSYARMFLLIYLVFSLIGALALKMPIASKTPLKFVDTLLLSVSAMSTTGLSSINFADLTLFGQVVLILIMEFGGMGIYMLFALFLTNSGSKIGVEQRVFLANEQNLPSLRGVIRTTKKVFYTLVLIQLIGVIFCTSYIYFAMPEFQEISFTKALFYGVFLSVSLFMNAGFVPLPVDFPTLLLNGHIVFFIGCAFLIFLGGLGYIPLISLADYIKAKVKKTDFRFSKIAKILFFAHVLLWIFGFVVLTSLEFNSPALAKLNGPQRLTATFFTSISARSAGFSVIPQASLAREGSIIVMIILMFIGASPNSAGGGVRTTTVVLIIAAIFSHIKAESQTKLGKKLAFKEDTVKKAFIVATAVALVLIISIFVVAVAEQNYFESQLQIAKTSALKGEHFQEPLTFSLKDIVFELVSAFGLVGYSRGLTFGTKLLITKWAIIFMMFFGRVGPITFLRAFSFKQKVTQTYKISEIDLIIS